MEGEEMKGGSCCGGGGGKGEGCKCPHHKMIPLLIVLFGLLFLLEALGWWGTRFVEVVWPILVILGGLQKMMGGKCKCC